jgi:hypothetical protein
MIINHLNQALKVAKMVKIKLQVLYKIINLKDSNQKPGIKSKF